MPLTQQRLLTILVALAVAAVVACSNNDGGASTPPASPSDTATATATANATTSPATQQSDPTREPDPTALADRTERTLDVANVTSHVEMLAGTIGIRAAGTDGERAAADYIAGVLDDAGYDTAIEPFPISTRTDGSTVEVAGEDVSVRPFFMTGSATAQVAGPLVYAALGSPADFAAVEAEGRIVLLDRGVLAFGEKARNAELAGALAILVANNEAGRYNGNVGSRSATIPVLAITRAEGERLRPFADAGTTAAVRASIDVIEAESQNVVGRAGETCRFYIGGHYDSVPAGPGANDNASGTALILELARVHRIDGLCVIAFGAEEIGLRGSQAYVAEHGVDEAVFMLNFDMAGRLDDALIIGDDALTALLLPVVDGFPIRAGQFPPFASSDHVSFLDAGVPAVTITSGDDPLIHSAGDDTANVSTEALTTMLEVGERALTSALTAAG